MSRLRLALFRTLWGITKEAGGTRSIQDVLPEVKAMGYEGLEMPLLQMLEYGPKNFKDMLAKHGLRCIPMIFTDGPLAPGNYSQYQNHPKPGTSVQAHVDVFKAQVEAAMQFDPVKITSHSGADCFTAKQAEDFFSEVVRFESNLKFPVCHETHRRRILYSPWVCRDLLPKFPKLKLVADLSHFTVVTESNTDDPALDRAISMIAPHVQHIHGRIGYDQGPQVNDPRAEEWRANVSGFSRWWGTIFRAQRQRGLPVATYTPEHGPAPYQPTQPHTKLPLAEIWEVNNFMGQVGKTAFEQAFVSK